jgi:hypothetical protein
MRCVASPASRERQCRPNKVVPVRERVLMIVTRLIGRGRDFASGAC